MTEDFPPLIRRIVQSGERNERIVVRPVNHADFARDVRTVLEILNDAWSGNWGFVPFTETEINYASKKLKPLFKPETAKMVEFDGRPVAFMIALPDMNEVLTRIDGKMLPFGWISLLRWIRNPRSKGGRVPLMGVLREFHNSRLASQFAFMMIDAIRAEASVAYGLERAEIGWILDDNQGMIAIAEAIGSTVNREYLIYEKAL